jgi:hypothetical protein
MLSKDKVYLLLAVLLAAQAMALGIAPGELDTSFGATKRILIINNDGRDMDVVIYAEGDLENEIEISEPMLTLLAGEKTREITITVNKPEDLKPGKLKTDLIVMEVPKGTDSGISARQAVKSHINVVVPYPGKYAEARLKLPEAAADEEVGLAVEIRNLGGKGIESAHARIDIFTPTNDLVASLQTNELAVEAGEMRELVAYYTNGLPAGKYYIIAELDYDGSRMELKDELVVGKARVELKNLIVKGFRLGDIAKFDIEIESLWNEEIDDVYADLEIRDGQGGVETTFKTAEQDLPPLSSGALNAYWDTSKVVPGPYRATVTLHFLGNNVQRTMALEVSDDAIDVGMTAKAIEADTPIRKDSFIIIVALVTVVNTALIIYFLRKRNAKQ